ncbi:MAG: hypothetical protein AAB967_02255, partial [Patescibacteria group bacterium]
MLRKIISISSSLALFALAMPVGAVPAVNLPPAAGDNAAVRYLGQKVDPATHELVEGYAIVHYRSANVSARAQGAKAPKCYGFLASGAKWKSVEPWVVNPSNSRSLDPLFVFNNLSADVSKWEDATDGVLGNGGANVLGDGSVTASALTADTSSPDNVNEVYFADVASQGAIAVTIVWGVFGGPPSGRKLVEWDQVYDDVDYDWSASGEALKMDFENIATHELG